MWRDRHGKKRETRNWYIGFRDHLERVQRLPAFKDKAASRTLGERIEQLLVWKARGQPPDLALMKWIETLRPSLQKRLVRIGLLNSESLAATRPLKDHAADYRQNLLDKGDTTGHADLTANRIVAILEGIAATSWLDLKASAVQRYLAERRTKDNLSAASSNHYLRAFKGFCKWMVDDLRARASPVAGLKGLNVQTDRRHERRALTADEVGRLIEAAADGDTLHGMSGPARAMLYRLAVETGLRAGELRSLTQASFHLDEKRPTITVEAIYSKRRKKDIVELRPETARDLLGFLARKAPAASAFNLPKRPEYVVKMLRVDLAAARQAWVAEGLTPNERKKREESLVLAYRDDAGRVADFHALRHTAGSLLLDAGVNLKAVQVFMRHSTITLTADLYGHAYLETMTDAVTRFPDFSGAMRGRKRKGGKAGVA